MGPHIPTLPDGLALSTSLSSSSLIPQETSPLFLNLTGASLAFVASGATMEGCQISHNRQSLVDLTNATHPQVSVFINHASHSTHLEKNEASQKMFVEFIKITKEGMFSSDKTKYKRDFLFWVLIAIWPQKEIDENILLKFINLIGIDIPSTYQLVSHTMFGIEPFAVTTMMTCISSMRKKDKKKIFDEMVPIFSSMLDFNIMYNFGNDVASLRHKYGDIINAILNFFSTIYSGEPSNSLKHNILCVKLITYMAFIDAHSSKDKLFRKLLSFVCNNIAYFKEHICENYGVSSDNNVEDLFFYDMHAKRLTQCGLYYKAEKSYLRAIAAAKKLKSMSGCVLEHLYAYYLDILWRRGSYSQVAHVVNDIILERNSNSSWQNASILMLMLC